MKNQKSSVITKPMSTSSNKQSTKSMDIENNQQQTSEEIVTSIENSSIEHNDKVNKRKRVTTADSIWNRTADA